MKFYNKLDVAIQVKVYDKGDDSELIPRWDHRIEAGDSASYKPNTGDNIWYKATVLGPGTPQEATRLRDKGQWIKVMTKPTDPGVVTSDWVVETGLDDLSEE